MALKQTEEKESITLQIEETTTAGKKSRKSSQSKKNNRKDIASEDEVLKFYTDLLREKDVKVAEAIKAAEFFVKYLGILESKKQNAKSLVIVDDIAKAKEEDSVS